jgi:hypothetical protein
MPGEVGHRAKRAARQLKTEEGKLMAERNGRVRVASIIGAVVTALALMGISGGSWVSMNRDMATMTERQIATTDRLSAAEATIKLQAETIAAQSGDLREIKVLLGALSMQLEKHDARDGRYARTPAATKPN